MLFEVYHWLSRQLTKSTAGAELSLSLRLIWAAFHADNLEGPQVRKINQVWLSGGRFLVLSSLFFLSVLNWFLVSFYFSSTDPSSLQSYLCSAVICLRCVLDYHVPKHFTFRKYFTKYAFKSTSWRALWSATLKHPSTILKALEFRSWSHVTRCSLPLAFRQIEFRSHNDFCKVWLCACCFIFFPHIL